MPRQKPKRQIVLHVMRRNALCSAMTAAEGWEQFVYSETDARARWFNEIMDTCLLLHPSERITFQIIGSSIVHRYSADHQQTISVARTRLSGVLFINRGCQLEGIFSSVT